MLGRLVEMFSGGKPAEPSPPPLAKAAVGAPPKAAPAAKAGSVMRREAMLGRDQKVAAYTFMLRRAPDELQDASLPDVQRLYDETLLNNLTNMEVSRLLAQRQAFIPISPASLDHPLIAAWPTTGTVWCLKVSANTQLDDALLARLAEMKAAGHSFALDANSLMSPVWHPLLPSID